MKKILFSRLAISGVLILIQIVILMFGVFKLSESFVYFYVFFVLLSLIVVIYIVSRTDNPSYKLAWTIPVLLLPVFGGLFYLLLGGNKVGKTLRKEIDKKYRETEQLLKQDENIVDEINENDARIATQIKYIYNVSKFPVYKNTETEYLTPGEKFYERLLEELKKAKKYIFMEYFIINIQGEMWNSVLEILKEKVKEGVDVRLIYDDMGCMTTLPNNYNKELESYGIKTMVFNPIIPIISAVYNNRDHRKITIIDGITAFTGGINLADEYINKIVRFGHWKDASIMIKGDAVWNFTVMFLRIWNNKTESENPLLFKSKKIEIDGNKELGYVLPFGDSPYDNELIGENVYLNIINKAKDYVYINSPYLIVDNELVTALTLAAKSGIDVRIVTPHKEDKWYVHMVTRAYYAQLIEAGVKIYEYTPGFIHSKTFVSDDVLGVVGTINLDYRSLYLHFECATLLYKTDSVLSIKKDFEETLEKCQMITLEDTKKVRWSNVILRSILRVFAPLM